MQNLNPILACGSMDLGPGFTVLMFSLAAIWLVGIVLAFVNLFWIVLIKSTQRFKTISTVVFLIYTVPVIPLFGGAFNETAAIVVPIAGFPILSISHFIYLFCVRRKLRKQKANEANCSNENPPCN